MWIDYYLYSLLFLAYHPLFMNGQPPTPPPPPSNASNGSATTPIPGSVEHQAEYKRCFQTDIRIPQCRRSPNQPNTCFSVRGRQDTGGDWPPNRTQGDAGAWVRLTPFSCHGDPCSPRNEALWLGVYAVKGFQNFVSLPFTYTQPGIYGVVRNAYISQELNSYFRHLINMEQETGEVIPEALLEKISIKEFFYLGKINEYLKANPGGGAQFDNLWRQTDMVVPLPCDPRSYLQCRYGIQQTLTSLSKQPTFTVTDPKYLNPTPSSECLCHPLYSKVGNLEPRPVPQLSGSNPFTLPVVGKCLGRANVPCAFGKRSVTDVKRKKGEPTSDRSSRFLEAVNFDDYYEFESLRERNRTNNLIPLSPTEIEELELYDRTGYTYESPCVPEAECLPFADRDEENQFLLGHTWHGIGYSPIIRHMMIMSASRICKCRGGRVANKMHECVEGRADGYRIISIPFIRNIFVILILFLR